MSRIVAGGLEMQDITNGRWFGITVGGLDAVVVPRGENVVIPGKTGQIWMPKVADLMPVTLHGVVFGTNSTPRVDYLDKMDAIRAVFDPLDAPFNIVVHPDAVGVGGKLATGETATITVEFLRFTGPPAVGDEVREFDIECQCISDPMGCVFGS
jgi:hypothetical protein